MVNNDCPFQVHREALQGRLPGAARGAPAQHVGDRQGGGDEAAQGRGQEADGHPGRLQGELSLSVEDHRHFTKCDCIAFVRVIMQCDM